MIEGGLPHVILDHLLHAMGDLHLVAVITTLLLKEDTQGILCHLCLSISWKLFTNNSIIEIHSWINTCRSVSPNEKRYSRERSYSRSPPPREHKPHSVSPVRERSPYGSRSRSQSPGGGRARSPVRARTLSHSRSRSPHPAEYSRGPPRRERSPSQWKQKSEKNLVVSCVISIHLSWIT